MSKSMILWPCFGLIIAFIAKELAHFGLFRNIETKGLAKCRLIVPSNGDDQAFEDLDIDQENGIAYMPGDNRTWWHTFSLTDQVTQKHGSVFKFDIQSKKFQQLNLVDYPYEHFHPLGVNLFKRSKNYLFMTNFRKESNGRTLGAVEIFTIDSENENQIKWIESVVHPLFTVPDDVLVINETTFYVTNVYHYPKDQSVLMHTFEFLAKRHWTNVLLCSKSKTWQCSIVADSIFMANGIAASLDFKTVYVAASGEKRVRVYGRRSNDNSLVYQRSLDVPFFVDNILVGENDQLTAAGHPNGIAFLLHVPNPRSSRAPSEVVVFSDPRSNSKFEHLLLSKGELMSGSTVGGIYKQKLLVGALCDHGILFCQI